MKTQVANKIIEIRKKIEEALPFGRVIPRHSDKGHFYEIIDGAMTVPPIYSSVTGKLNILKDESLINFKMNRVLEYFFGHYKEINESNIMEHIAKAEAVPQQDFESAGDIGTRVHLYRQSIFEEWIKTGIKPKDFISFIPEVEKDIRAVSAVRALKKFVDEYDYIPVVCELLVYSHKLKVAGTLDDLGIIKHYIRKGDKDCQHEIIHNLKTEVYNCLKCDMKYENEFILLDLKTSNSITKPHYFFQVALYCGMFVELTGLKPKRCIILQVSKEKGDYKILDLKKPTRIFNYAKHFLKVNDGLDFIRLLMRDNQKNIIKLI